MKNVLIHESFKISLSHGQYRTCINLNTHRYIHINAAIEKVMSLIDQICKQVQIHFHILR